MGIQGLLKDVIVDQVKSLISSGINRFSKVAGDSGERIDKKRVALWIYADDNSGLPKLKVLRDLKTWKSDVSFGDLANTVDKMKYLAMGFDVEKDTPVWIQKFILRSAKDTGLDVTVPKYLLAICDDDDLHAFMYVNGKQIREVEIEYILNTK